MKFVLSRQINVVFAVTLVCISIVLLCLYDSSPHTYSSKHYQKFIKNISRSWIESKKEPTARLTEYKKLNGKIDLLVRLTLKQPFIQRLYCDVLRSSSIFWNSTLLGEFLLIFDEAERDRVPEFMKGLRSIPNIPHSFRSGYDKALSNLAQFEHIRKLANNKPLEYFNQLYSSFFMDLHTDKPIIAWIDTDTAFVTPVLPENIINSKGQLIVKGWNSFDLPHTPTWRRATEEALGAPMPADFMTYFPMFLYTKTIRNCRNHIIKHLNVSTFEEAFRILQSKNYVSPCNVIMSYAYHFEYDSYEWHFDIKHELLETYNKKYCPSKPLELKDLTPAIHLSAHATYSKSPLERAICSTNYYIGLELNEICKNIVSSYNLQLFEFDKGLTHFKTWCKPENFNCSAMVEDHYEKFREELNGGIREYKPGVIRDIEKSFQNTFNMECPHVDCDRFFVFGFSVMGFVEQFTFRHKHFVCSGELTFADNVDASQIRW